MQAPSLQLQPPAESNQIPNWGFDILYAHAGMHTSVKTLLFSGKSHAIEMGKENEVSFLYLIP